MLLCAPKCQVHAINIHVLRHEDKAAVSVWRDYQEIVTINDGLCLCGLLLFFPYGLTGF